jgi:hypothetical protein
MGSEEGLKKMVEEEMAQDRLDLAEGRARVVNFCHTCPFAKVHDDKLEEGTGKPLAECEHPATWVPPEPLKVTMREYGFIPLECPLRVKPTTVYLDPREGY